MDITYRTRELWRLCNTEKEMTRRLGAANAKTLQLRMVQLAGAEHLGQMKAMPGARLHQLTGDRAGQFAVSLRGPMRLVLVPDHDPVPRRPDGGVDVTQITAITIIEVEDYHG